MVRVTYLKEYNHHFFSIFLNKFLKHVFNIALKLFNHTWTKYKINFLYKKNEAQISGFAVVKKLQVIREKIYWKKAPSSCFCTDKVFKTVSGEVGLEIFNFWWFYGFEKFFTAKSLIKLERQKIKNISHTVLDKIIFQIISENFSKIE